MPLTTFVDDLLTFLAQLDPDLVIGTNLYQGLEPPEDVLVVTVYAEPGPPGATTHDQVRPAVEFPRARVICRSQSYNEAQLKAEACYNSLWVRGVNINDHNYQNMWPMGRPYGMGPPDGNLRHPVGFLVQARQVI